MKPQLFLFLLLLAGCGTGGSKESHSNAVDTVNYEICNEDGTINDLSVTEQASDEETPTEQVVAENATTETTTETVGANLTDGISPAVPNDGIGIVKSAVLSLADAEMCAENHDCRILATDGEKASVEHCGNVTIVVVPK